MHISNSIKNSLIINILHPEKEIFSFILGKELRTHIDLDLKNKIHCAKLLFSFEIS